jgi:hypothetical protein
MHYSIFSNEIYVSPVQIDSSHLLDARETYMSGIVPIMDNLGVVDRT